MNTIGFILERHSDLCVVSDSPLLDTKILLCHVIECPQENLYLNQQYCLTSRQLLAFNELFRRRLSGEPIAYLTGYKGFWSLNLRVSKSTLIPRPETELLIEKALELPLLENAKVLDLGTGCGAIILALSRERPTWVCTGIEIRRDALGIAEANRASHHVKNVKFLHGDWYQPVLDQKYHLIASNPPYVANGDQHLSNLNLRFEPRSALISGEDGMRDLTHIICKSPEYLLNGGWMLTEHGSEQGQKVRNLYESVGFRDVGTFADLSGLDRVTLGCVP